MMAWCFSIRASVATVPSMHPHFSNFFFDYSILTFQQNINPTFMWYLQWNWDCHWRKCVWKSCCQNGFQSISEEIGLTHWGGVTHICIGNLTIIGPDNGLSPGRRQAIIWTNAGILLIGPLGKTFSEILIGIQTFSFKIQHLKMASAKWRPFCLGLNVLTHWPWMTSLWYHQVSTANMSWRTCVVVKQMQSIPFTEADTYMHMRCIYA